MGYTQFTIDKLQNVIDRFNPKSVMDLGAQNNFAQPLLPAPYISEWYEQKNILYTCIDLNGENEAIVVDLSKPIKGIWKEYDMLVDAGTSEHVGNSRSEFEWEAIYNCWVTKHTLLKHGGVMYSENPKTGNWPKHGRQYYTQKFYNRLIDLAGYELLDIGEHAACNNNIDGWNVFATMRKVLNVFPSLKDFKTLDLRQS